MTQLLSDALAERGYDTLTPVQEAVTRPELAESDLLVSAQTGSGKTVGFGLAIAPTLLQGEERMGRAAAPLALVIAPTRELAFQVMRELSWLYEKAGAKVISCVGGMDMRDERRALERGAHIVVATPGRLRDHIQRGSIDMTDLRAVVLDEADEMLDLGFREDLEFILGEAPASRRTLLFSATVSAPIAQLAKQYQRDAERVVTTTGAGQHADIEYRALTVAPQDSENAIINVLRFHDAQNAIVFANTRAMVNRLTARFSNRGFSVVALSGELSQNERTHALQAMRDGRARVCVATDVAARGIDLPNLELVIHAELPSNAEGLLHRSGRTGRAGRKGVSTLIVTPKIRKKAERLLKFAKITAEWAAAPSAEEILAKDEERLLGDPVWTETPTEAEAAFAEKLLSLHGPETIAAAYLRLYRSRQSAPEDLSAPGDATAPRPKAEFGPGKWFSLSAGRDDRAEPRWLLPLLCRAGNISKDSIGAIRIQQSESFVEIAEADVAGFLKAVGDDMTLEDGIKLKALNGAPDLGGPGKPRGPKPAYDKPKFDKPRGDKPAYDKPRADKPKYDKPRETGRMSDRPQRAEDTANWSPAMDEVPAAERPEPKKERWAKPADGEARKSGTKPGVTPYVKRDGAGESRGKPFGKPGGKPAGKPGGKPGAKPWAKRDEGGESRGKPYGKPGGKPGDKPFGKPGGKPAGKPKPSANDTSKRFTPPGKPGGKPGPKRGK